MTLAAISRRNRLRRTDRPASDFERPLRCTRCGDLVLVMEAVMGWRVEADNHFTEPGNFRCLECLEGACAPAAQADQP